LKKPLKMEQLSDGEDSRAPPPKPGTRARKFEASRGVVTWPFLVDVPLGPRPPRRIGDSDRKDNEQPDVSSALGIADLLPDLFGSATAYIL
jgi:hypothetical protein